MDTRALDKDASGWLHPAEVGGHPRVTPAARQKGRITTPANGNAEPTMSEYPVSWIAHPMNRARAATCLALVLCMGGRCLPAAEPPPARLSLEEIRAGVEALRDRLMGSQLYLQYRVEARPLMPQASKAIPWMEITFVIHQKQHKYYCEHLAPQGRSQQPLLRKSAFDGRVGTNLTKNDGNILPDPVGVYWLDTYLQQLGFPYREKDVKAAAEAPEDLFWLPNNFAKQKYAVLDRQEAVEGGWCHVVSAPGADTLWIDVAHGFALRKRELHWSPGKPLRVRILNSAFREAEPALWLPWTSAQEYFGHLDEPEALGKIIMSQQTTVKKLEVNKPLPDDFFELQFPVGAYVKDAIKKVNYRVIPPGLDTVEAAIQEQLPNVPEKQSVHWLTVALLAFSFLLIGLWLITNFRRRRRVG
jgi:hypothetical protein